MDLVHIIDGLIGVPVDSDGNPTGNAHTNDWPDAI